MSKKGSWAFQMVVIIFMTLVLFFSDLLQSNESIIERVNKFPFYMLFLLLPLIGFVYTIVRKNTFASMRKWMLDNFMKYFTMFFSLVVTTYVVYYVFIIGNPQTWFGWLTAIVILADVFVVFLLMKHLEEKSIIKLDGKTVFTRLKFIGLLFVLCILSIFGVYCLYKYILSTSNGLVFMGTFQGIMLFSGISVGMEKEFKGRLRIFIGLIGNAIFLFLVLWFEPFRGVLEVTESATILTYVMYLGLGTIIILAGFLYGYYAKENNIVIRMFKELSTKHS
jgi:hypothetical protein